VYVHPQRLELLREAQAGRLKPSLSAVLSPFDPLVWDRARCKALFGFDYSLECYLPQAKRKYGYFSLPLLVRGALVGRMDAKAHRKENRFEIKSLHLEPHVQLDDALAAEIAAAIRRCAAWHGAPQVTAARPQDAWATE
ncbi:MAG: winged helix DNA-binding domain-containing protein, partial [Anaerolineaceae bacterium]|nr:winged helix DNA-binding domain-containing protein [Anaerolineaceae bacterium]